MTPSYYANGLYQSLKKINEAIAMIKMVQDEQSQECLVLESVKESLVKKIEVWLDIKNADALNKNNELVLYVVRNSKGQYFRAKGFSGSGESWVDDINKAKIYGKIGGARGTVTYFAQNPKFPVPEIVKLTVTGMEVIDEKARVQKVLDKKAREEQEQEKRRAERQLKAAQEKLALAQAELNRLQKKK